MTAAVEPDPFGAPQPPRRAEPATIVSEPEFPARTAEAAPAFAPAATPVVGAGSPRLAPSRAAEDRAADFGREPLRSAAPPAAAGSPNGGTVVVGESDSYWTISERVYGSPLYYEALARANANQIPDPTGLRPGMRVAAPPAGQLRATYPHLCPDPNRQADQTGVYAAPGFLIDEQGQPAYRVGRDDTLSDIAYAHLGRASRWVQVYELNRDRIADVKKLKPGTVLRLPADASRVRLVPQH